MEVNKAVSVLAAMMLLVSVSPILSLADVQPNKEICKKYCMIDCFPETRPDQPCMKECLKGCTGNSLAIDRCNLDCMFTRCLDSISDMDNVKACAKSCSKDCEASPVAH